MNTRLLASTVVVGAALAVALISAGLTGPCGGYSECGADSNVVIASTLAWLGLAGVVATVVFSLRGARSGTAVVLCLTVIVYFGWLVALLQEYGG
jgi:hypothetical protein